MSIQLGKHTLKSHFALAPMAGWTDVPFRTLAWRYGAAYMVSEMVSDKPELWETGKSRLRRIPVPGVQPVAVQLAGTDPEVLAESARRHVADGVQVIDLNFGCPVKKVCRKLAGSALLAQPDLVTDIVSSVVAAVDVPVTVKTRTGLTPADGLGVEVARRVEDAGASMLVVHARSRACRFVGEVDYAAVAAMKAAVSLPVLVNGDIGSPAQAERALAASGADGVMIGRAAVGRPWLFAALRGRVAPSHSECLQVVEAHVSAMHDFYGEHTGVRMARKHMAAYARTLKLPGLAQFQALDSAKGQLDWLAALKLHRDAA